MKALLLFLLMFSLSASVRLFADDAGPTVVEVAVTVPDSAWKLEILEAHQTDKAIIVISKVSRDPEAMGAQVITTLSQKLNLITPELPVQHYVLGKTWGWENEDKGVVFIKERKELEEILKGAKKLPLKE